MLQVHSGVLKPTVHVHTHTRVFSPPLYIDPAETREDTLYLSNWLGLISHT